MTRTAFLTKDDAKEFMCLYRRAHAYILVRRDDPSGKGGAYLLDANTLWLSGRFSLEFLLGTGRWVNYRPDSEELAEMLQGVRTHAVGLVDKTQE